MSIYRHSARTEFWAYIEVLFLISSVSSSTEGCSKYIVSLISMLGADMPFCLALEVMIPSEILLVGNLKGNFLVSFAVGWACTTVSQGSVDAVELSVEAVL